MAELKTQRNKASVTAFLAAIPDPDDRKEAKALAALMRKVTGEKPEMWGTSIVGYGEMTYEGSSGRSGVWFPVGFAPRKSALTLYLMGGVKRHPDLLKKLGPHKVGGGCLYLTRFKEVDTKVLTQLIKLSYKLNRKGTKAVSIKKKAAKP